VEIAATRTAAATSQTTTGLLLRDGKGIEVRQSDEDEGQ
jgi:hypothetical protein